MPTRILLAITCLGVISRSTGIDMPKGTSKGLHLRPPYTAHRVSKQQSTKSSHRFFAESPNSSQYKSSTRMDQP